MRAIAACPLAAACRQATVLLRLHAATSHCRDAAPPGAHHVRLPMGIGITYSETLPESCRPTLHRLFLFRLGQLCVYPRYQGYPGAKTNIKVRASTTING